MGREPQVTLQTLAVLKILLDQPSQEHYGLELASRAGLPAGTIYPILARLERAEWVTSAWEEVDPVAAGRPVRRYYQLTSKGIQLTQNALQDAYESLSVPPRPSPGPAPDGSPA
jgi:DNA-binding PadR family transcriptional regulator